MKTPERGNHRYVTGVLSARTAAKWMAAALAGVAALSLVIGFVAPGEGFNWIVATAFGTALGTTALAGFTGALAFVTSGDLRATWQLADLTKQDQDARERPIVVLLNADWRQGQSYREGSIVVECRNVGLGPALNFQFQMELIRQVGEAVFTSVASVGVLMPGEIAEIRLPVTWAAEIQDASPSDFEFSGTYTSRRQEANLDLIIDWLQPPEQAATVEIVRPVTAV